ncbi:MAG TPA: cupin domain-containing protein [Prolixibacteraceae bacterium]|nr:cupin domain-containing protein [Prolixibacteraceae bacterium]
MNQQIQEIAERLRGLRDLLSISVDDMAQACNVTNDEYLSFESGENDIPIAALDSISRKYKIELTALLFGNEPKMKTYYLTRAGQGTAMERTKAYKYKLLASGFIGRKADPFIVTVEPSPNNVPIHLNSHEGQEFNLVLEGKMLLSIDGHELTLNPGDSLYFDATLMHGMKALDNEAVKFLAIIF